MPSFFSHIHNLLTKITSGIKHLFTPENIAKAESVAATVSDLAAIALPYVELVASATETPADDALIAAAAKMNRTLQSIFHEPDPDVKRGLVLGLLGHATRDKLTALVAESEGQKVKVGSVSLRVPDDVSNLAGNWFDLAVQAAYSMFVKPSTH